MIIFDLRCDSGHRFEGWFGSSADYAEQQDMGLISCPHCGSLEIEKAPMAPAVSRKGNSLSAPADGAGQDIRTPMMSGGELSRDVQNALKALAKAQAEALKNSTYVGDHFAETSRAMHYGERDTQAIHGKATAEQARELIDEGINVSALPFPIAEPDELN